MNTTNSTSDLKDSVWVSCLRVRKTEEFIWWFLDADVDCIDLFDVDIFAFFWKSTEKRIHWFMFRTPALAFFYEGLVDNKNILNQLFLSLICIAIVMTQWCLFGFSFTFGPGNCAFGSFEYGWRIKISKNQKN